MALRFSIIFLLGFLFGPIGDIIHVVTKTTGYPDYYSSYILFIPWWVYPFFGFSGLVISSSFYLLDKKLFQTKNTRPSMSKPFLAMNGPIIFLISYIASGVMTQLQIPSLIINFLFFLITLSLWMLLDRTKRTLLMAFVFSAIGILVETTLIKNGVFWYNPPDKALFGVPTWLPWIYMILVISLGNFTLFVMDKKDKA